MTGYSCNAHFPCIQKYKTFKKINPQNVRVFVFCSGVVVVSVFPRYGITSLGNWWPAFRDNPVVSKKRGINYPVMRGRIQKERRPEICRLSM